MAEKTVNTTVEILGKFYPVRCSESEVEALQEAARFLNQKMTEVQDSGKAINLERIAIISALNISYEYLQLDQQKSSMLSKINQKVQSLQNKLEIGMHKALQTELVYSTE